MKQNIEFYKKDIDINHIEDDLLKNIKVDYIEKYKDEEVYEHYFNENTNVNEIKYLSNINENIVNWYPFKKERRVLEINSKLGNVTRFLCNNLSYVTSVCFLKSEFDIVVNRLKNYENLTIYLGKLSDIKFEEKFDYIVAIGVLEYAPLIFDTKNPYVDMLVYLKSLLSDDGKLLLSVDNSLGIKYFAGAKNAHSNEIFSSIIGKYENGKLFTKNEIEELLDSVELKNRKFYYPLPDYNYTSVVFSDDFMPSSSSSKLMYNVEYLKDSIIVMEELSAIKEIARNNYFPIFSNSFFIEIQNGKSLSSSESGFVRFASYNNFRKSKYKLMTRIFKDHVEKSPINKYSTGHISQMSENIKRLKELGFNIVESENNGKIVSNFITDEQFNKKIINLILDGKSDDAIFYIKKWYDYLKGKLLPNNEELQRNKELSIFKEKNIDISDDKLNKLNIIKDGYIDLVFENTFYRDGEFLFYDQEWFLPYVPIEFILYRAVNNLYSYNMDIEKKLAKSELFSKLNIHDFIDEFKVLESYLQNEIIDSNMIKVYYDSCLNIRNIYDLKNIEGFKIDNEKLNELVISLRQEKEKDAKLIDEITNEKNELQSKVNELNDKLNGIYNSKSWKMIETVKKVLPVDNKKENK